MRGVPELAARCGGLPLLLRVVAARLASEPGALDGLDGLDSGDSGDPATSLRAVFGWSEQRLSPAAGRAFRLLGSAPVAGLEPDDLAAYLGVGAGAAQEALAEPGRRAPGRPGRARGDHDARPARGLQPRPGGRRARSRRGARAPARPPPRAARGGRGGAPPAGAPGGPERGGRRGRAALARRALERPGRPRGRHPRGGRGRPHHRAGGRPAPSPRRERAPPRRDPGPGGGAGRGPRPGAGQRGVCRWSRRSARAACGWAGPGRRWPTTGRSSRSPAAPGTGTPRRGR
ncbi:hypothetical protein [Nocardioides convexus]|uniref:hypothetical protein n=1 Tax=Nocardioides convexus TaxID=2712224 RepID=UPI00241820E9|nr:hypothetical protein [Nocardioides convexus]